MKIVEKIKKIVISISVFFISIQNNCYAQILYAPPPDILIAKPSEEIEPSIFEIILNMLKKVCIPIILLIGIIVYLKKSKTSKKKKILIVTGLIIIVAILYKAFAY